jgi:hypothetical protein
MIYIEMIIFEKNEKKGVKQMFANAETKPVFIVIAAVLAVLTAGCEALDAPPDPNRPLTADDTMDIAQLTSFLTSEPGNFDSSVPIKMKGAWESFADTITGDPLGQLYMALDPLSRAAKTIKLDFSRVNGRNIANGKFNHINLRSGNKKVIAAVKLPEDMQYIGSFSFYGCENLGLIEFAGEAPPDIGQDALQGINSIVTILVPDGAEANYQALKAMLENDLEVTVKTASEDEGSANPPIQGSAAPYADSIGF